MVHMWSKGSVPDRNAEILRDKIQELAPKDDDQRALKAQASSITVGLAETRWLQYEQLNKAISIPLLVALVAWLTMLFISFGLMGRRNATVVASLLAFGLSVSSAIFLILESYSPYTGLIRVSSAPFRAALTQLGK
jgi:hypothetical protein